MRYSYLAFLLFFALVFTHCSLPVISKESPAINEVAANSQFTIILPEDHRTGYTWQMTNDFDPAVISRLNDVWHGNEKGIYFNIKSLAAGQTTLTFVSRKYQDTLDIKHFIVKIEGN